jgi:hypothetical protein
MMPKKYRSAFAKFKSGVAPISLETGIYEQVNEEDMVCQLCYQTTVESEMHVILFCSKYDNLHRELFANAAAIETDFDQLNDVERLIFLFSAQDICFQISKTWFNILSYRRNMLYRK